jgi:hypothetical protein
VNRPDFEFSSVISFISIGCSFLFFDQLLLFFAPGDLARNLFFPHPGFLAVGVSPRNFRKTYKVRAP